MDTFIKKVKKIEILIIILFPILVGSLLFVSPFYGDLNLIDEGQFAAWANHMMHGEYMFKDMYITYGPLFVYPVYLGFKFFGPSAFMVRILFGAVSTIMGATMAYLLIKELNLRRVIGICAVFFVVIIPGINIRIGLAYFVLYFIYKSYYSTKKWDILLGASVVLATLITPEVGIYSFILCSLYYFFLFCFRKKISLSIAKLGSFFLGCSILLFPFLLWARNEGWLGSYITTTIDVLSTFSGINLPNGQKYPNPLDGVSYNSGFLIVLKFAASQNAMLYWELVVYLGTLLYLFFRFLVKKFNRSDFLIMLLLSYAFFLYMSLIGRAGNFFLAFSPTVIIFAFFTNKIFSNYHIFRTRKEKVISFLVLTFIALFILRALSIFRTHLLDPIKYVHTNSIKIDRLGPVRISNDQKTYISEVQEFVSKNTDSSDKVFFLTDEPMMYMFVDRVNPTRYDLPFVANTIEKRYEILNSIIKNKPKYIFDDKKIWAVDGINNHVRLPELYEYISQHYVLVDVVGTHEVLRLKH